MILNKGGLTMTASIRKRVLAGGCAALFALVLAPGSARAEEKGSVELFGGGLFIDSRLGDSYARLDVLGLRAAWGLSERWSLEGSASHIDNDSNADIWGLDVSARYLLNPGKRSRVYVLGGPGWLRFDGGDEEGSEDSLTLHAGLGVEIPIQDRFYFRPDVKLLWLEDDPSNNIHTELTLGFGLRF